MLRHHCGRGWLPKTLQRDWSWTLPLSDSRPNNPVSKLAFPSYVQESSQIRVTIASKDQAVFPHTFVTKHSTKCDTLEARTLSCWHVCPEAWGSKSDPQNLCKIARWYSIHDCSPSAGQQRQEALCGLLSRQPSFIHKLLGRQRTSQKKWIPFLRIKLKVVLWPSHTHT